jgi:hypothetical protein
MIVEKTYKVGIDSVVAYFQEQLYSNLLSFWDVDSVYTCYPRANKNYKNDNILPEISLDQKDYLSTLFDDKVSVNSFFLASNKSEWIEEDGMLRHNLAIIFQADLISLYGSNERADERFKIDVLSILKGELNYKNGDISVSEGVDQVYSDLTFSKEFKDKVRLSDMSNRYVVKFEFEVNYRINCMASIVPVCAPVNIIRNGELILRALTGTDYPYETGACDPVTITLNEEPFRILDSGEEINIKIEYQTSLVDPIASISGNTIHITDPVVIPTTRIYPESIDSGQITQYGVGDTYWRKANNIGKLVQSEVGVTMRLQFGSQHLLEYPNIFGHLFRLTGLTGGYYNPATSQYYTKLGVLSTYSEVFTNNIGIDHLRSRLIDMRATVSTRTWVQHLADGIARTTAGFTGWYLPSVTEIADYGNWSKIDAYSFGQPPFDWLAGLKVLGDTYAGGTTQCMVVQTYGHITSVTKANSNRAVFIKPININTDIPIT